MMDKEHFRKRSNELRVNAERLGQLGKMPDRVTDKDLRDASNLMLYAAMDLDELLKAQLPGCVCRRVQDDYLDYLDYAESCRHHRHLCHLRDHLKAEYAKMEKALKDEVRMSLVRAALSGAALSDVNIAVERALMIADETLRQIAKEPRDA
jgi:hypothetical protein